MMPKRGLYKYKWHKDRNFTADITVMTLGVLLAALSVFAVVRYSGNTELPFGIGGTAQNNAPAAGAPNTENLKGSAPESSAAPAMQPASVKTNAPSLTAKISITRDSGYAYVGQKDVPLLRFTLTSPVNARLKQISFSVDGYAASDDLSSLQLYYENKLAEQAPVNGTDALFNKIDILMEAGKTVSFIVKGNVAVEARSGDRVQVGIVDASDILLADETAILVPVEADYPLWGGLTSIIGNKIRK